MPLDANQLRRLSALFDRALELSEPLRESWLGDLSADDAALTPALRAMLARRDGGGTGDLLADVPAAAVFGANQPDAAEAGQVAGPYRLERLLGEGGMGEVWLAERVDGLVRRKVALKLPHAGWAPGLAQRFAREREILAALEHPHIARLYDVGVDARGRPFMALEYVEGEPITAYAARHALGVRARVALLLQVADAVAYAHRRGVLHRDLKAANVLVRADGHAQLLDFGVAKLVAGEGVDGRAELTELGARALTLHCAAPEQIDGAALTPAADVWALGVLLYELLAGRRPFDAGSRSELEAAIRGRDPVPPSRSPSSASRALRRDAAADLDTICAKALAKLPQARYAGVDAFAADLRRWLDGEAIHARPESFARRTLRWSARHRVALAASAAVATAFVVALGLGATALVIAALAIGLGAALWQTRAARRQARIAGEEARTSAAVQAFIEGIFAANSSQQASPAAARTRTAKELLDDAAARIDDALGEAPHAKLRLLRIVAQLYMEMQEPSAAARLQRRRQALAAALHGAASSANAEALAELGFTLVQAEDIPAAREALDAAAALLDGRTGPHGRAEVALDLGRAMFAYRTDPAQGVEPARRACAALAGAPVSVEGMIARDVYARCLHFTGQLDEARRVAEEGIAQARVAPDRWAHYASDLRVALARIAGDQGDVDAARSNFERAMQLGTESVGPAGHQTLSCMGLLGQMLADNGRVAEGAQWLARAFDALAAWPDSDEKDWQVPIFAEYLGGVLVKLGRPRSVLACTSAGLRHFEATKHNFYWAERMHAQRAEACLQLGRCDDARRAVAAAQALVDADPHPVGGARAEIALAHSRLLAAEGRGEEAREHWLRDAAPQLRDSPLDRVRLDVLCMQAEFELAAGAAPEALAQADAALVAAAASPLRARLAAQEAQAERWRGEALLRLRRPREAEAALAAALRLAPGVFDERTSPFVAATLVAHARALRAIGERTRARDRLRAARDIAAANETAEHDAPTG